MYTHRVCYKCMLQARNTTGAHLSIKSYVTKQIKSHQTTLRKPTNYAQHV